MYVGNVETRVVYGGLAVCHRREGGLTTMVTISDELGFGVLCRRRSGFGFPTRLPAHPG